jgi:hypothetical protein
MKRVTLTIITMKREDVPMNEKGKNAALWNAIVALSLVAAGCAAMVLSAIACVKLLSRNLD